MVLCIHTNSQKKVKVSLKKPEMIKVLTRENEYGSQVLLPLIIKLLQTNDLELRALSAVEVETGPGSFTGLRVGVAVANAMGFALGIPVNGKKIEIDIKY